MKDREIARNYKRKNETQVQVLCIGILLDQTGMTGDDILQAKVYMKCFTTLLAPSKENKSCMRVSSTHMAQ
jgi:hypothetical protein